MARLVNNFVEGCSDSDGFGHKNPVATAPGSDAGSAKLIYNCHG